MWLSLIPLCAQPVISENGVVNAASFMQPPAPGSALAPGSIFSVFGQELGTRAVEAREFPLQETLGGVSVEIATDGGEVFQALILYASEDQVNAVLPSTVPVGEHTLAVIRDGERSAGVRIKVVRTSVGIFTEPYSLLDFYPYAVGQSTHRPLTPGDPFSIWATGLGPIDASDTLPAPAGDLPANIQVWIGDRRAEIEYRGRSACCAGLDQIQVRVPDGAPTGCVIPVWVAVNGALFSNIATIATVAEPGQDCRFQPGFAESPPGSAVRGRFTLSRSTADDRTRVRDEAQATFIDVLERSPNPFRFFVNRPPLGLYDRSGWSAPGTCRPEARPEGFGVVIGKVPAQTIVGGPDGGDRFQIESPQGLLELTFRPIPIGGLEATSGILVSEPRFEMLAGDYEVRGEGGADFPSFEASLLVPPPPSWTIARDDNDALRSRGFSVEWAGVADAGDVLIHQPRYPVRGRLLPPTPQPDLLEVPGGFTCRVSAAADGFEIPEAFLANLVGEPLRFELTAVDEPVAMELPTDGPESGLVQAAYTRVVPMDAAPPHLPSTPVFLPDGTQIQAELATSPAEHQRGLMFRPEVPRGRGMLFLFARPGLQRFWMRNTLTPLDMIFMDSERRIVLIAPDRQPCPPGGPCPLTGPDEPAQFVLELAAGEAARLGLAAGARLDW